MQTFEWNQLEYVMHIDILNWREQTVATIISVYLLIIEYRISERFDGE